MTSQNPPQRQSGKASRLFAAALLVVSVASVASCGVDPAGRRPAHRQPVRRRSNCCNSPRAECTSRAGPPTRTRSGPIAIGIYSDGVPAFAAGRGQGQASGCGNSRLQPDRAATGRPAQRSASRALNVGPGAARNLGCQSAHVRREPAWRGRIHSPRFRTASACPDGPSTPTCLRPSRSTCTPTARGSNRPGESGSRRRRPHLPGLRERHGFCLTTVPAPQGRHNVCVFATNVGPGKIADISAAGRSPSASTRAGRSTAFARSPPASQLPVGRPTRTRPRHRVNVFLTALDDRGAADTCHPMRSSTRTRPRSSPCRRACTRCACTA